MLLLTNENASKHRPHDQTDQVEKLIDKVDEKIDVNRNRTSVFKLTHKRGWQILSGFFRDLRSPDLGDLRGKIFQESIVARVFLC